MKKTIRHLSVDIRGETTDDLEDALREVLKKVSEGYKSGMDSNDTGQFLFEIQED